MREIKASTSVVAVVSERLAADATQPLSHV